LVKSKQSRPDGAEGFSASSPTGVDSNGAKGVVDVKAAGGTVLAQDKATPEYFTMPEAAIATGWVHAALPIGQIGPQVVGMTGSEPEVEMPA
jgi:chemotaxis response regulator CheB